MRARVKIGVVGAEEIEVDGQRIEGGVKAVRIEQRAGHRTEISVELSIIEAPAVEVEGDVRLLMTDSTRKALIALGWTPPEG